MKLGYIGLGKMGVAMVERLREKKHDLVTYDVNGAGDVDSVTKLVAALTSPRAIWLMIPHETVDAVVDELQGLLEVGDTIFDGGNSFYKDSMRRAQKLFSHNINFMDIGVSGGPQGARHGASLMIGGPAELFRAYEELFHDMAGDEENYGYMGDVGAGHFVKMVHNGIEYGMMQSIAEGFSILKQAPFELDVKRIARVYNHGSVIESRLMGWLNDAYAESGDDLKRIAGEVAQSGEGKWTVDTASELGVSAHAIEESVRFRDASEHNPSYTGQIISALRGQFGGHYVEKE